MKRWIKSVTKRAKAALSRRSSEATTNKKKEKKKTIVSIMNCKKI